MGVASDRYKYTLRQKCASFGPDGKMRWTAMAVNDFAETAFRYYGGAIILRNGPRILRAMNTVNAEVEAQHATAR